MRYGPAAGVVTDFVIDRSAAWVIVVSIDVALFAGFRSAVVEVTLAALVAVPAAVACTVIVTDRDAPDAISARVQVTVPLALAQPAEADTNVVLAGSASMTVGATEMFGPAFATVTV